MRSEERGHALEHLNTWTLAHSFLPWGVLVVSVVAVYWLQPFSPVRYVDFVLPTAVLCLTVLCWFITRQPNQPISRQDYTTLLLLFLLILALSLNRYLPTELRLTPSRPPNPLLVTLVLVSFGLFAPLLHRFLSTIHWSLFTSLLLLTLFLLLKTAPLATAAAHLWRTLTGENTTLASPNDLNWLGFSYVAFRLLHTLRDRQTGLLPALSLREFASYVLFFPTYLAGPIDRAERFAADFRALSQLKWLDAARVAEGFGRICLGVFKKFVIADSLALGLSLNPVNAAQATSAAGLWLLLYGYAFRLYFDFSGYSDIAIGLGILLGVRVPENFNRPYLQPNLTLFWQSWHMTLSSWARFYVFSPLSRWLLKRKKRPSSTLIVFSTQLATMLVIGLWHGVSWNFFIWGLWHGVGLFGHKQWSDRTRKWTRMNTDKHGLRRGLLNFVSWFITFHYVLLGWVWFVLPQPGQALQVLGQLLGTQ